MKKIVIGQTKNHKTVYANAQDSHAATHLADTPSLLALVRQVIAELEPEADNIYLDKDMGRTIGLTNLVTTGENDEILYAKRPHRTTYTRFALHRQAEPTRFVTIALRKDAAGDYELWSAWLGRAAPQFPGDEFETPASKPFWQSHALVWGTQAIEPGSETPNCPWN